MNRARFNTGSQSHLANNRWKVWLAMGVIVAAAFAAYRNTFSVPLLFDDLVAIQANPSIHHLGSLGTVLSPPNAMTTRGRPFLNLTFAINYAEGGVSVRGYHILNLLIHIFSGITVFKLVRMTLVLPRLKERYGSVALTFALAVATLWTVHPIQTESVTYITQRAESLMGLFYLLTLYFFIKATLSPVPGLWTGLSIAACALGMMTKEVMVSAPLVVLLYDRTFAAGSFREAWRQRRAAYLGLAATWLILADLMVHSSIRRHDVGYGGNFTGWTYALTESKVVVEYLKLALWPHPLVLDYGPVMISRLSEASPYLLLLLLLLGLTLFALRRWPSLGFLGAWFFLILAPTSSIVPLVGQPMAEHRLYLPSLAIVTLEVAGLCACVGRKGFLAVSAALAIVFGILTASRNSDYRSELAMWNDAVSKYPGNFRAHYNLALALSKIPGRTPEAITQYEVTLRIDPYEAKAHNNLGTILARIPGRMPEAIAHYEAALRVDPDNVEAHSNLGTVLDKIPGRLSEAIAHYEAALRINPDYVDAHNNLGTALAAVPGRMPEAIAHFEAALKADPDCIKARNNLGSALSATPGRASDAIAQFEAALKIDSDYADVHYNLANLLVKIPGRMPEAIGHYEAALKINPDYAEAHFNLGNALLEIGDHNQEAWTHLETAQRLRPDWEPLVARLRAAQP